jgi:hypothetical protein
MVRRMFDPKRKQVGGGGGCRRLHVQELHNLYTTPNIVTVIKLRRLRWVDHVARMVRMRNAYEMVFGIPECKRPLEGIGLEGMDCVHLAQDRDQWWVVKTVINLVS